MFVFLKAQVASFTASVVDYCCMLICAEVIGIWYVWASAIGTFIGGVTNFTVGRQWVFKAQGKAVQVQAFRYILVWIGYMILTTWGVFMFTHYLKINYVMSKVLVSLFLAVSYNYPLQKKFVFNKL